MENGITCEHLNKLAKTLEHDLWDSKEELSCFDCGCPGPNLWICLQPDCYYIGCSEAKNDHSTRHQKSMPSHCVHMNISTERVWCYACEREVYIQAAIAYSKMLPEPTSLGGSSIDVHPLGLDHSVGLNVSLVDDGEDHMADEEVVRPRGLVGLQNMGNTCYMNAALQALSNAAPLTSYFLECGPILSGTSADKKPALSRAYQKLIREMWDRKTKNYVVPNGILYGIRNVHPQFRGYHQHDTQEFLRCFMDQLHEELKVPVYDSIAPSRFSSEAEGDHNEPRKMHFRRRAASSASDAPLFARMRRKSPAPSTYSESRADDGYKRIHTQSESGPRHRRSASYATSRDCASNGRFYTRPGAISLGGEYSSQSDSVDSSGDERYETASSGGSDGAPNKESGCGDVGSSSGGTRYRSIISDIFDGQLLSSVQCLVCNRVSTRVETFQDLSLPIPSREHLTVIRSQPILNHPHTNTNNNQQDSWLWWVYSWLRSWFYGPVVSLQDCLAAFFSADELKGDNMYSCSRCNKLRNGIKLSLVTRLPEVLCVHLKRFRHELMFSAKVAQRVAFPVNDLDMSPYVHKDCVSQVRRYALSSVIVHCGTAGGGHYTCVNRRGGNFYTMDDHLAIPLAPHQASSVEAYVLFYRKVNPEMDVIRQKANEILQSAVIDPNAVTYYISKQWINKFNCWAEPGRIDNSDFACAHGRLRNDVGAIELAIAIPTELWKLLLNTFGGGPVCTSLSECSQCYAALARLAARRCHELAAFATAHANTQDRAQQSAMYAISMPWFRAWQAFVRSKGPALPPPPIDNSHILCKQEIDGVSTYGLKPGSDYAQLNEDLWRFFLDIYGGGPEIRLTPHPNPHPLGYEDKLPDTTDNIQTNYNYNKKYSESDKEDYCVKSSSETNIRFNQNHNALQKNQSLQNIPKVKITTESDDEVNYRQFYTKTETNGNFNGQSSDEDWNCKASYDNDRFKVHNGIEIDDNANGNSLPNNSTMNNTNNINTNNINTNNINTNNINNCNKTYEIELEKLQIKSEHTEHRKIRKNKRRTVK